MADESIFDLAETNGYKSPFGNWEEEDFVERKSVSIPTIIIDKDSPDTLEINERTLLIFKISGQYQYIGGENFSIELMEDYSDIEFTTKEWTELEKGWRLKTYATAKKSGSYTIKFKVNGVTSNSIELKTTDVSGKSKYKVLLFGGIDYANDGTYGSNATLAKYLEILVQTKEYNIPMQKGDIQVVNSPLFSNEFGGKDVYNDILEIVKDNYDVRNGTLILYGYSWGGQLLLEFLDYFKASGVKISLLITVDAAKGYFSFSVNNDITDNVGYNLNLYQTKFYKGLVWSRGWPNEGSKVKNINLTDEKTPSGDEVKHSNIDEYTLFFCTQVILYALKNDYNFYNLSEEDLKISIKNYADQGY